jgi:hypothetical protein
MRRVVVLLVMIGVALVAGSGIAFAAVKFGTDKSDFLIGTNSADQLFGKGGSDFLAGKKQDDILSGGDGNDVIHGGAVGWGLAPDGHDKLIGGDGSDCMFGGSQDDVLIGGSGTDDIGHYCYEFIFDTGNDIFTVVPAMTSFGLGATLATARHSETSSFVALAATRFWQTSSTGSTTAKECSGLAEGRISRQEFTSGVPSSVRTTSAARGERISDRRSAGGKRG